MNMLTPKRALISVSDKTGVADFARNLVDRGFELVSTGGTCKFLKDSGLAVTAVETLTGFPEILDGRVKTLHPIIHGGLLGDRRRADHLETMKQHNISGFSLLVLNLYPFAKTVDSGSDFNSCIENIDIGGPAMLRASAKNHANVLPIISPDQFPEVLRALDTDTINTLRKPFAARAFGHTAEYDRMVNSWLSEENEVALRYGENPHQKAKLLKNAGTKLNCAAHANQLQGKELSYNNYLDADSAWELCQDLAGINAVIVKHNNPCGAARGENLLQAFKAAKACDPVSAFGGVIALSAELDKATAEAINSMFVEVVLAPSISKEARAVFSKKPNVRLLLVPSGPRPNAPWSYRTLGGATLRQSFDYRTGNREDLRTTTKLTPSEFQIDDLLFAFTVAKHTKSNAIILAKNGQTLGIGAGQMSRVDAARIAQWKARDAGLDTAGCVVASDAFFPFADGLEVAIESGASAVVQPGGSMRDNEVITAADKAGLAMVFTGIRHFRH
ncbi:MAG: bifunctional phosphoribosylaminoimidazolecarboxamide formyltransferase/IMP cyclohydrolase [Alphaproteobacteria bacterium]